MRSRKVRRYVPIQSIFSKHPVLWCSTGGGANSTRGDSPEEEYRGRGEAEYLCELNLET